MIQLDNIPAVIGKSWATLNAIQEETGTSIKLPKKGMADYTYISGPDKQSVDRALDNIRQIVSKGYCDITDPNRVDDGVNVPRELFGKILANRGEHINTIRDCTGAEINFPDRDSDSTWVTVTGEPEPVKQAITALQEFVDKGFSSLTHEGWTTKEVQVPRDQLGNIIGPSGRNIRDLEDDFGVEVKVPPGKGDSVVSVRINGEEASIVDAMARITELITVVEIEIPPEWTKEAVLSMQMVF